MERVEICIAFDVVGMAVAISGSLPKVFKGLGGITGLRPRGGGSVVLVDITCFGSESCGVGFCSCLVILSLVERVGSVKGLSG